MNSPDSSDRLERLKQVLADSYPQRADGQAKEPLPESIRAVLRGEPAPSRQPEAVPPPLFERLLSLFRRPQFAAVAVTAVVVLVAVLVLNRPGPQPGPVSGPEEMRSTGGDAGLPSLVVLSGLGEEAAAELEASGYFRDGQLLSVPEGADLNAFLETHRRPNLVLVDGTTGELSAPFAGDEGPSAVPFAADDPELAERVLDLLSMLPEGDPTPED